MNDSVSDLLVEVIDVQNQTGEATPPPVPRQFFGEV